MFKVNQIVLITKEYKNERKSRIIGVISKINDNNHVSLAPLPEKLAKPFREKYCTKEYNYQGHMNCYSDSYGFASDRVSVETTIVLGEYNIPKPPKQWSPGPGNLGYDLMC